MADSPNHASPFNVFNMTLLSVKTLELRKGFTTDTTVILVVLIFTLKKILVTITTYLDKKCKKLPGFVAAFSPKRNLAALLRAPNEFDDPKLLPMHGLK